MRQSQILLIRFEIAHGQKFRGFFAFTIAHVIHLIYATTFNTKTLFECLFLLVFNNATSSITLFLQRSNALAPVFTLQISFNLSYIVVALW